MSVISVVLEQGLEGAQAQHVVDQFARERPLLPAIELNALLRGDLGKRTLDFLGQLLGGQFRQRGRIHLAKTQRAQFDDRRTGRKLRSRRRFGLLATGTACSSVCRRPNQTGGSSLSPSAGLLIPNVGSIIGRTAIDASIRAASTPLNCRASCRPGTRLPPGRPAQ